MLPSDLDCARLCASIESDNPQGFDLIDKGAETGIFYGIKRLADIDIIDFRGSIVTLDWLRDGEVEMVYVPGLGFVHGGFLKDLDKIKPVLRPHPIFIGHSLGAAHASIMAAQHFLSGDSPTALVIFGCPRPGTQQLADVVKNFPGRSYKNGHDPVTDLPETLPGFPWTPVMDFTPVDGLVTPTNIFDDVVEKIGASLPLVEYHHMFNYIKGMENLACPQQP